MTPSPSVLIVRLDAIGDALTTVPLIAALRRRGMRIGVVLRTANAHVYADRAYDRAHIATAAPEALASEIRAANYDYALIATEKPAAYRLAYRARIPRRIGFENGWGKPLKTLWIRRMCTQTVFRTAGLDPRAPHECDVMFSLARSIVPDAQPPRDAHALRPLVIDDEPQADRRVAMQVTAKWQRLGASLQDVAALARQIAGKHDLRFVSASAERDYAQTFIDAGGFDVEFFDDLRPWKSAIAGSRAVVAPDSGAAHVAGMTGTPVVSCFAAEHFALQTSRWSPWAAPYRAVKIDGAWPLVAADALDELLTGSRHISYTG
jgi:ADP-heptose:LPS heptosyltransferase